jgi:hypothetical protein
MATTYFNCAVVHEGNSRKLWTPPLLDGSSDYHLYYYKLPNSYADVPTATSYYFNATWSHYTPKYYGGFIDIEKVWTSLTLKSSGLTPTTTWIDAYYSVDGGTYTFIGTFDTSPIQSHAMPGNGVVGKEIRLRFDGTNPTTSTGIIEGFALHGLLRPPSKKEFRFTVKVGDDIVLGDGSIDRSQTSKQMIQDLRDAYRTEPIELEDEWGDKTKVILMSPPGEAYQLDEKGKNPEYALSFVCREVIFEDTS